MPARKQEPKESSLSPGVFSDKKRHTCILCSSSSGKAQYIPLCIADGMVVREVSVDEFQNTWKAIPEYPLDRAADLYIQYALDIGAESDAIDYLSKMTKNQKEAIAKVKANGPRDVKQVMRKKSGPMSPAGMTEEKARAKPSGPPPVFKENKKQASKKAPAKKAVGPKKPSAASRFRELIMEGKLSDQQIFAAVQKEFGLDDKRFTYVKWYRDKLRKDGLNPPEAKEK